ncbi:hypothetical protein [Streptomyces sp. S.PB5]|uniref:hypothetical protein n=1 Tax=Streptomyces sp. S.PB5 TaxID=3020844 RepID=UPI00339D69DA
MTAVSVLVALALFVSACATGGTGTRDEGPAYTESSEGSDLAAGSAPSATAAPAAPDSPATSLSRAAAARLVKDDPTVSADVKSDLQPCGDDYPVDVLSGDLTGGASKDVVVNVLTCGDEIGVGSYVYRVRSGAYENVFKAEESPVYALIDRGDLVVTKQVYEKGDQVTTPSGEYVVTYRWTAGRFVQRWDQYNQYGDASGATPSTGPAD